MLQMEPATGSSPPMGLPSTRNLIDTRNYVLHYGLKEKRLRKMQSEAYLKTQQKIVNRGDAARAMVLSANLLGMSVMTSQLSMYRWKVSEASTMTQATSRLQEEVMEALKKGYQVRRTQQPRAKGKSKYADRDALEKLFRLKMEQIQRRKERREARREAAAEAGEDMNMALMDVVDSESVSLSDVSSDESPLASGDSSLCSIEKLRDADREDAGVADGRRRNTPPADMVSSVVIVDSFTHEPYEEIIEHLRYIDKRYDLNLVVILLLPKNDDARELQGAGVVLTPDHQFAMEDAYSRGYDLVLTHYFDHVVVEFLTDTFVSSSGRWRNDVRAKAAVGNYISLKNILMGRIDINVLKQLAWNDEIDDAGLLDMIGQNSLALHGEAKRIGLAGQTLSKGRVAAAADGGGQASDEFNATNGTAGGSSLDEHNISLPANLARYRTRQMNVHGVTLKKDVFTALEDPSAYGGGLASRDMLGNIMAPSGDQVQHTVRRRRKGADPEDESEDAYEYVLVTIEEQNKNAIQSAFENEMTRLIAENERKNKMVEMLSGDVERLTRTVAVLKRNSNAGGEGGEHKYNKENSGGDMFTGSLMNLSKEQQIYILKERLDMANEQIATLMEDGQQRRSRSGNSRDGGGNSSWSSALDHGGGGGNSGRINKKLQARNRRLYRGYNERREHELLMMHDYDADQIGQYRRASSRAPSEGPSSHSSRPPPARQHGENADERRRRREQTDRVVAKLQNSLSGEDGAAPDSSTLQSALDLIHSQQQRVSQLEDVVRLNGILLDTTQAELKLAKDKLELEKTLAAGASAGGKKGKGKKNGSRSKSITSTPSSSVLNVSAVGGTGGGGAGKKRRSTGKNPSPATATTGPSYDEEAIVAALREELLHDTEVKLEKQRQSLDRKHRAELRKRGTALKSILQRLYLRIKRPYTQEYLNDLRARKQQEEGDARGLKQRLQYLLNSLRPEHLVPEEERQKEGSPFRGLISSIADPEAAKEVQVLAREYAQHSQKAKTLAAEIKEIEEKMNSAEGEASLIEALNHWEAMKGHTAKVSRTVADPEPYLRSLEQEIEAEEEVKRWGMPSVVSLIEKGTGRKTNYEKSLQFSSRRFVLVPPPQSYSLNSPGPPSYSTGTAASGGSFGSLPVGQWTILQEGEEAAAALGGSMNEDIGTTMLSSILYVTEDPVLQDMHQAFRAVTSADFNDVLIAEGLEPVKKSGTGVKKHKKTGASGTSGGPGAKSGGGAAGDNDNDDDDDEDDYTDDDDDDDDDDGRKAKGSSSNRKGAAGTGAGTAPPHSRPPLRPSDAADGTFLTGTGLEEDLVAEGGDLAAGGKPPLAPHSPHARATPVSGRTALDRIFSSQSSRTGRSISMGDISTSQASSFSPFIDHPGVVEELVKNDVGKTKIDLYSSALQSYRSGFVHPDRMMDIEKMAQSPEAVGADLAQHYLTHHQELLRLLQLLALRTPALGVVLEEHTEELEQKLSHELRQSSTTEGEEGDDEGEEGDGGEGEGGAEKKNKKKRRKSKPVSAVTVPFLMSYDTAAVTWYVDYLCRTMPEHKTALGLDPSVGGDQDLRPNRSLRHLDPGDERLQLYEDVVTVLTQPYGLAALGDEAWASPVDRRPPAPPGLVELQDLGDGSSGSSPHHPLAHGKPSPTLMDLRMAASSSRSSLAAAARLHSGKQKIIPGANRSLGAGSLWAYNEKTGGAVGVLDGDHNTVDMSHIPEDVAALFTRRDGAGKALGGLTPEEIYLENELDREDDEADDENLQLMRDIKMELEYLAQLKEERLAELRLRLKYRQKQVQMREKSKYEGWERDTDSYPADQEVPDFEVKGATAAWYGMEAAKRVKDILKRRQRPDQIILGSGGVGVELSKRTAFPRPPQKELDVIQSIEERMRAAHRVLPPLRRRGLSRWQQQLYKGLPTPDDLGYIDPREEAIVNAFGRCASINHHRDSVGFSLFHDAQDDPALPPGLSQRVLAFRHSLQQMGLRGPGGAAGMGMGSGSGDAQNDLGSPFYTPILTDNIPASPAASPVAESARRRSLARLDLTSWVYGVPGSDLQQAVDRPLPEDGKPPSTVVFLPSGEQRERPSPTKRNAFTNPALNRNAGAGMALHSGNRAGGRRILPNQNSIYNPYRALGKDQFVTPSAVAAQRLSLMLRASATDPSLTVRSPNSFLPTGASPQTAERWWGGGETSMLSVASGIPMMGRSTVERGPVEPVKGQAAPLALRPVGGGGGKRTSSSSALHSSSANFPVPQAPSAQLLQGTLPPSAAASYHRLQNDGSSQRRPGPSPTPSPPGTRHSPRLAPWTPGRGGRGDGDGDDNDDDDDVEEETSGASFRRTQLNSGGGSATLPPPPPNGSATVVPLPPPPPPPSSSPLPNAPSGQYFNETLTPPHSADSNRPEE